MTVRDRYTDTYSSDKLNKFLKEMDMEVHPLGFDNHLIRKSDNGQLLKLEFFQLTNLAQTLLRFGVRRLVGT